MTTHRAIIDSLIEASAAGDATVLATVVRVTGSSYGGVGARMLIRVDGSMVGLVSGGCLESDLAEHSRRVTQTGKPEIVRYDTRDDDDAPWGLGLGCNGLIDILIEPLDADAERQIAALLENGLSGDTPSVVATVIRVDGNQAGPALGAHALITEHGVESIGRWGALLEEMRADFRDAIAAGRRGLVKEYAYAEVAFEVVLPSVRLVVCGTGPDALPIASLGAKLGWEVSVIDHRAVTSGHAARFPGARLVECSDAKRLAKSVKLTHRTAAVVASHHFERDRNYLEALLASDVAYIGMLGPRARTEKMLADISRSGGASAGDPRLFAPVGMDIGGDGPDSIALSIIAEVSGVMLHRDGGHLRDRRGPLHPTPKAAATPASG